MDDVRRLIASVQRYVQRRTSVAAHHVSWLSLSGSLPASNLSSHDRSPRRLTCPVIEASSKTICDCDSPPRSHPFSIALQGFADRFQYRPINESLDFEIARNPGTFAELGLLDQV